jgi:hypothetical protein
MLNAQIGSTGCNLSDADQRTPAKTAGGSLVSHRTHCALGLLQLVAGGSFYLSLDQIAHSFFHLDPPLAAL